MHRIFIIGQDGLIGTALTKVISLQLRDHATVHGISRENLDLSCSSSVVDLAALILSSRIDSVVVLAANKRQLGDGRELMLLNNKISDNIAAALSNFGGHVTYISSCAVYGEKNAQVGVDESCQLSPTSFYGEHKIYGENIYKSSIDHSRLLILRPPLVYGPLSTGYDPIGFLHSALRSREVYLWGDGSELREFVHVYDTARVIASLAWEKVVGTLNLVSGHSYSYSQIVTKIQHHLPISVINNPRSAPPVSHTYTASNVMKFFTESPFVSPLQVVRSELARQMSI